PAVTAWSSACRAPTRCFADSSWSLVLAAPGVGNQSAATVSSARGRKVRRDGPKSGGRVAKASWPGQTDGSEREGAVLADEHPGLPGGAVTAASWAPAALPSGGTVDRV